MPLADEGCLVAAFFQESGDVDRVRWNGVPKRFDAVDVTVLAGQYTSSARRANGIDAIGSVHADALCCQSVDTGRFENRSQVASIGANCIGRMIIRHDVEDIHRSSLYRKGKARHGQ